MVRHSGQLLWLFSTLSCSIEPGTLRESTERRKTDAGTHPAPQDDGVMVGGDLMEAGRPRSTYPDVESGSEAGVPEPTPDRALADAATHDAGPEVLPRLASDASTPGFASEGETAGEPPTTGDAVVSLEPGAPDFDGVRWQRVSAGTHHTCRLTATGGAQCWGNNAYGQMGDGSPSTGNSFAPVDVIGVANAVSISAGTDHSCVLDVEGAVYCWGDDASGQLGDGDNMAPVVGAVAVDAISDAIDVQVGVSFSCALLGDGTVRCWGMDGDGQLGESTDPSLDKPSPVAVDDLGAPCVGIGVGGRHACAVLDDGSVKCWGWDYWGQIGDGPQSDSVKYSPVQVQELTDVMSVYAGHNHTCAILRDGSVRCWGYAEWGQLGIGPVAEPRVHIPTLVPSLSSVVELGVGDLHTCALLADESVWCWGADERAQLGNGEATSDSQFSPVQIIAPASGVEELSSVGRHTCVRLEGGALECWGHNQFGQLGMGLNDTEPRHEPTLALDF